MTGVSIFSPDDPAAADASPIARPETPTKRAGSSEPSLKSPRIANTANRRDRSEPQVVLRLPDLDASDDAQASVRLPLASFVYWGVIALGALLAGWLFFSEKKLPERARDGAPGGSISPPVSHPAGPPSPVSSAAPTEPAVSAPASSIR